MTAQEYIQTKLDKLAEPIVHENPGKVPLEDAIYAKVMSKKFRKLKGDPTILDIAKKAIKHSVENNKPIVINVIFGGNKLWRFDESPEIDWAELFVTIYYAQWLKSIASVYKPGAYLEFYSEDVVLETMNNLPPEETDQYSASFKTMLEWIRQYLPESINFGYKRYGEEYENRAAFLLELEEAKTKVWKELGKKLPELTEHKKYATELNVRLKPGQADDQQWREKAELIHLSIERTPTMERYINDLTMIPACPTYYPGCITTGSTKKSLAKFWVAVGALEKVDDSYSDIVLTPKQLETAQFDWESVQFAGLQGKNFSRIRVVKQ